MKYQIKKLHINNFDVYEENKLTARSYFIPYSKKSNLLAQNVCTERYNSELVTVLSGEWKFKYFERISRLPGNIDTDKMNFDTIKVPSTWQRTGYQNPCYLNTRYEFPMTLPVVPDEMSVGVYCKKFKIREMSYVKNWDYEKNDLVIYDLDENGEIIKEEPKKSDNSGDLEKYILS